MFKPQNNSNQSSTSSVNNTVCVHLVGAGPGDPELVTLKALRLLEQAQVVVYDRLVNPALLNHCPRDCDRIYVGKRKNCHSMPQARICELLVQLGQQGKRVVRLKGGDPFVFGRGGEEAQALSKAGIACQVIPGITAATGCAAATGIPLTHRDHAQAVTFITGHRKEGNLNVNWTLAAQAEHTTVFYMGLSCLEEIVNGLRKHGLPASTPIAVIAHGSTPEQEEICATLDDILHHPRISALPSPSLIIVGDVIKARSTSAMDSFHQDKGQGKVQDHSYACA